MLVAIDKFTKWIEARPISMIKSEQDVLFFLDIVHRFGVLNSIITDNGTQFTGKKFLLFCDEYCNTPSVCHQLSNGFELKHDMMSGDEGVKIKSKE